MSPPPVASAGTLAESPGDQLVFADPEKMRAMVRSLRQSSIGMTGFIREIAHLNGFSLRPITRPDRVIAMIGEQEPMFAAARTRAFWTRSYPAVTQRSYPDAGRMLHLTHAADVAAALADLDRRAAATGTAEARPR